MDSRIGKQIRAGRIFRQDTGNTLILAYSHGVLFGPLDGMRTRKEMDDNLSAARGVDAVIISPGGLSWFSHHFVGKDRPACFLHFDYQNYVRGVLPYPTVGATVPLATVEQALMAGADAIMTYLYIGHRDPELEKWEIRKNAEIARECERLGMVFMIEALSAREITNPEDKSDAAVLGMSCRIAAELGADIVKCQPPGSFEAMQKIAETCPVPLLYAGGAKTPSREQAYQIARDAMAAGARGLVFGRNIFEGVDTGEEVARYSKIVHGPR